MRKKNKKKPKSSLKTQLLSMFLFSLFVTLTLSYLLHLCFFQSYYLDHYEERLLSIYHMIDSHTEDEEFHTLLSDLDYEQEVDITIVDSNLRYATRSHSQTAVTEERLQRELHDLIVFQQENIEKGYICLPTSTEDTFQRLTFVKILSNGKYCVLSHPWEPLESNMQAITQFHFLVGGVACIIGSLCTLFFAGRFTRPIIEISKATEGLSQLDFQQKITYCSENELGELANSINILSCKLNDNRKVLKNEIEFQKVLSQNMSHELKTPISVMKGYLECLTHGVAETEEEQAEYLQIVLAECDRMTSLIDRMLHLSKLTSFQDQGLEKEEFTAMIFAKNFHSHCALLLQQHQLQLDMNLSPITFYGNLDLLIQGFGNFLSNAVKYGDKTSLEMRLYQDETWQYLSLFNSGPLVPDQEKERIFNVFYMLDKSRSREGNSHGLGLAVSKTVAELHQGTAFCQPEQSAVEGDEKTGMVFTIKLPKKPPTSDSKI